MNRFILASSTVAAVIFGAATLPASAGVVGSGMPNLDTSSLTQEIQYMHGGRRFCFYPTGWQGPGWYRCGFAWRRGLGWGGGIGWNGWDRGGRHGSWEGRRGGPRMEMRRGGDRDMRMGGRDRRGGDRDMRMGDGDRRGGGREMRGGMEGRSLGNDRTGTVRGGGGEMGRGGNMGGGEGGRR